MDAGFGVRNNFWWSIELLFLSSTLLLSICFLWTQRRAHRLLAKIPYYRDWPIFGDVLHFPADPGGEQTRIFIKNDDLFNLLKIIWVVNFADYYKTFMKISEDYRGAGLYRVRYMLALPTVNLISPAHAETLLKSTTLIDKSQDYEMADRWLGLSLLTSSGDRWKNKRRVLTPSFHFNILKDFVPVMHRYSQILVEQLREHSDSDEIFNVSGLLKDTSLDIIVETAMGVQLQEERPKYIESVNCAKTCLFDRMRYPWLWTDFIFYKTAAGRKYSDSINYMQHYAYKVIAERRDNRDGCDKALKYKAFLDTLLDCVDEGGAPLSDADIREEVDTFMFEGHDTVTAALNHALFLLGLFPEHQKKCQMELDEIFESEREIIWDDLSKMKYLELCIKETLRIFPSVPWFGRKLSHDIDFGGYLVPSGTQVYVFTSAIHRDPVQFPNPEEFDPLRFTPDRSANRHPYAYIPFSAGPRNCIGQRFALLELKIVLASILHKFTVESVQSIEELKLYPEIVLMPAAGIQIRLKSR